MSKPRIKVSPVLFQIQVTTADTFATYELTVPMVQELRRYYSSTETNHGSVSRALFRRGLLKSVWLRRNDPVKTKWHVYRITELGKAMVRAMARYK